MFLKNPSILHYFGKSDIGKRYDHNEDFFALPVSTPQISINKQDIRSKGLLFVLCDGVGGLNAGEVASQMAATWILKEYYSNNTSSENPGENLRKAILNTNERLYHLAQEHESYRGMGTTVVAALFFEGKVFVFSAGDSRFYNLRGDKLIQITEDQSEVWQLYKSGQISKDELRFHPRNNIITVAMGTEKDIELQSYVYDYQKNDLFLLCSDGLSDMVGDEDIKNILQKKRNIKKKVNLLIDEANKNGGKDNITAILVEI